MEERSETLAILTSPIHTSDYSLERTPQDVSRRVISCGNPCHRKLNIVSDVEIPSLWGSVLNSQLGNSRYIFKIWRNHILQPH